MQTSAADAARTHPLLAGVLVLWLVLTAVNQLHGTRLVSRLKQYDYLGLLPLWTFFAPNPGVSDYYLLFRDRLAEDTVTYWREVDCGMSRRWTRGVWNPTRRRTKALLDLTMSLGEMAQKHDMAMLRVTIPYLVLLHVVSTRSHPPFAEATQFVILSKNPSAGTSNVAFLSQFHRL